MRQKSKEHDPFETDEAEKGVNIVRRESAAGPDGAVPVEEQTISLRLTNVPLAEALRYVAEGSGMKYKIDHIPLLLFHYGRVRLISIQGLLEFHQISYHQHLKVAELEAAMLLTILSPLAEMVEAHHFHQEKRLKRY